MPAEDLVVPRLRRPSSLPAEQNGSCLDGPSSLRKRTFPRPVTHTFANTAGVLSDTFRAAAAGEGGWRAAEREEECCVAVGVRCERVWGEETCTGGTRTLRAPGRTWTGGGCRRRGLVAPVAAESRDGRAPACCTRASAVFALGGARAAGVGRRPVRQRRCERAVWIRECRGRVLGSRLPARRTVGALRVGVAV